jgi:uncharacterized membrane protein YfcA
MTFTTVRTLRRGITTYKAESKANVVLPSHKNIQNDEMTPLTKVTHENCEQSVSSPAPAALAAGPLGRGLPKTPWPKIAALVLILVASTGVSILKGGDTSDAATSSPVGIIKCTPSYWLTSFAIFPLIFAVWGYVGNHVIRKSQKRQAAGLPPLPGDCVWSAKRVIIVGIVSFIAGILASLLGVGGGMIKGPVLLELGMSADVTAATSSYMILFTSMSSSIQYIIVGKLPWDYGVVLFFLGVVASFAGQSALNWLVARYNKKSYIIFVIAFVIGTSAVLLIITEGISFFTTGGNNHFSWIC